MNVTEIFYSLQGEGPWLGLPAIFIRLSGCKKPYCPWCDTKYALHESTTMTTENILDAIEKYSCNCIVITGGEPFLQWEYGLKTLHASLINNNYRVQYETSGKVGIPDIDDAMIVCSPKYIDGTWRFYPANEDKAGYFKFLGDSADSFKTIESFIDLYHINAETVFIMPMGSTRSEQLSHMEPVFTFCRDHGYRMTPRLHILSFDTIRGV